MGIANLLNFVLNFASVIFVSRFLTPEEVGIYSVSVAFVSFAYVIRDFGVNDYVVQAKALDVSLMRSVFAVSMLLSWSIGLLLMLMRYPIASFYAHEGIELVIFIVALKFFLIPFSSPAISMFRRELQFNKIAVINVLTTLVQTTSTVYFAYSGQSYLSMALAAVVAQIFQVCYVTFSCKGNNFYLPSFKGTKNVFNFGFISMSSSFLSTLSNSAPDIILGKTLGFSASAMYSRSVGLKKMIVERVLSLVRSVHFPTFAQRVRNGEDGGEMLLVASAYLMSLLIPVLIVLSLTSEPLILFLFGEQWGGATYLASLICAYTILEVPYALLGFSLIAVGKVQVLLKLNIVSLFARVSVLMTSFYWELEQVVELLFVSYFITFILFHYAAYKIFGVTFKRLLKAVLPTLKLIPFSCAGSLCVFLFWQSSSNIDYIIELALSGILAIVGWLIGVYVTRNIYKKEVSLILHKTYSILRNRVK